MTARRERIVAAIAVAVVLLLGALVVSSVLDAQRNGRRALERLQMQQVRQLAGAMATRLDGIDTFAGRFAQLPWSFERGNPDDVARLQGIYASLAQLGTGANAGMYLLDASGVITAGILLLDEGAVGERYPDQESLRAVLRAGTNGVSGVHRGITTREPVIDIVVAVGDRGAFVWENPTGPESSFNDEVRNLQAGDTGSFSYLDRSGRAIASSDPSLIGRPLDAPVETTSGFHRDGGHVAASADVGDTGWRAVFVQEADEFEGELTGPLRSAILLLTLAVILLGGVVAVMLWRRLRAARAEQRRLIEMNRAQEEFIGIVSHELRTPVSGLLGFLQTTTDHWGAMEDEDRRRAVMRALANARRLQALTADVLDSSRIEAGEFPYSFDRLDLTEEVRAAVDAAQDTHPDFAISFDPPSGPVWVRGDAERLQQVLTNLLDNALRHSPPDVPVEVSLTTVDGEAVVAVRDAGPGIAPDDAERVFQKFVRGRNAAAGGTGLGLYISRRIVDAHGGRIWASGGAGAGATLTFTVPTEAHAATSGGSPS